MNAKTVIKVLAALAALAMLVCPPWMEFYAKEEGGFGLKHHGYRPVWDKPGNSFGGRSQGVRIHSSRLAKQLFGLGAVTLVLVIAAGRFSPAAAKP